MQVDIRVPPCEPVAKVVEFCQRCEDAGFSGVGFVDSQMYFRDTYVIMAQVLQATERLRVHPALTCPGVRHPSVVASAAKTVQEFGADRMELWLGRGGTAHRMVGVPRLRISEMRDAVVRIKALLNGESNVFEPVEGLAETGPRMYFSGGTPVPIYMAAGGPLIGRLTGELCDGVLLFCHPNAESLAEARQWVADGANRAGRDPSDVQEWLQMRCVVRDTREEAVRAFSPNLPEFLAGDGAQEWLTKLGIEYDISTLKTKFQEAYAALRALYPEFIHIMDWDAAEKICQVIPYELQEALAEKLAVFGDPDQVVQQMKQLELLGCHRIFMQPVWTFSFPEPEVRAFKEVIGPAFNSSQ